MRTSLSNIYSIPARSVALIVALLLFGCEFGPEDQSINPNIVEVVGCCGPNGLLMDIYPGVWTERDSIVLPGVWPHMERKLVGGFGFGVVKFDEILEPGTLETVILFESNTAFQRMTYLTNSDSLFLFVGSKERNASIGALWEHHPRSGITIELLGSELNVSSAVYWHGDDSKIVYYSYGNDMGKAAGYYLLDKTTMSADLLYPHLSLIGIAEAINGFDLSPDNRYLLIPDVQANPLAVLPPRIIEYDLLLQTADTFDVDFDVSFVRVGLWLRYHPEGNDILYCNFPLNALSARTTNDDGEMGIIDRQTRTKRVLDANTNHRSPRSVFFAPTWSPDGEHILYGSTRFYQADGSKGIYSLYILKNYKDPLNTK